MALSARMRGGEAPVSLFCDYQQFVTEGGVSAHFVRYAAQGRSAQKNVGPLPAGHSAAGRPARLFVDEILVNPLRENPK